MDLGIICRKVSQLNERLRCNFFDIAIGFAYLCNADLYQQSQRQINKKAVLSNILANYRMTLIVKM